MKHERWGGKLEWHETGKREGWGRQGLRERERGAERVEPVVCLFGERAHDFCATPDSIVLASARSGVLRPLRLRG